MVHVLAALVMGVHYIQWQGCSITVSCIWNGKGTGICVIRHYHTSSSHGIFSSLPSVKDRRQSDHNAFSVILYHFPNGNEQRQLQWDFERHATFCNVSDCFWLQAT